MKPCILFPGVSEIQLAKLSRAPDSTGPLPDALRNDVGHVLIHISAKTEHGNRNRGWSHLRNMDISRVIRADGSTLDKPGKLVGPAQCLVEYLSTHYVLTNHDQFRK